MSYPRPYKGLGRLACPMTLCSVQGILYSCAEWCDNLSKTLKGSTKAWMSQDPLPGKG